MPKPTPIRPSCNDIIVTALREAPTVDGAPMYDHVHLLTVAAAINDRFTAEGIDLEALVDEAIANQTVTIEPG